MKLERLCLKEFRLSKSQLKEKGFKDNEINWNLSKESVNVVSSAFIVLQTKQT